MGTRGVDVCMSMGRRVGATRDIWVVCGRSRGNKNNKGGDQPPPPLWRSSKDLPCAEGG